MNKVAVIVLCDVESFEHLGRIFNALTAVKEYKDAGDDVRLIFDGAGTKWVGVLSQAEHKAHGLYESVKDKLVGACSFCSNVFGTADQVKQNRVALLDEYSGHPSFRRLSSDGYSIITF
jgi:hypothetical protein